MRIGLVNPYSLDVPGGVQAHVIDLAEHLIGAGHEVSVLTPADPETALPPYAVSAGKAVPVPYNGSVARLAFGPAVSARARAWVTDGDFDVVHIHEPASPSVSLLALWAATGPIVATFHSAHSKSRSLRLVGPLLQPSMDKISGRIAVSQQAQDTVVGQVGGPCVVIPNGVDTRRFARPGPLPVGAPPAGWEPCVVFLGRFTEPRKGLSVLLAALPAVLCQWPTARIVVAGPGERDQVTEPIPEAVAARVEFAGPVSEAAKVALLHRADVYVAPNTGGESFGIILVEAMAAGAPVLAADLPAFRDVLDGTATGELFAVADTHALASALIRLLSDSARRSELSRRGPLRAARYDWAQVGTHITAVYDSVRPVGSRVQHDPSRLRRPAPMLPRGHRRRAPRL